MKKKIALVCSALLFTASFSNAESKDQPIGNWRSHLSYSSAVGVVTDGTSLLTATDLAFFTYNIPNQEVTAYSKLNGMADMQMSCIGYDHTTGTTILGYLNSNIDLFTINGFHSIPDLKLKSATGSKSINSIYTENGFAYLSTGVGVVVINLSKTEIKETYNFIQNSQNVPVWGFCSVGNYFYAATEKGLYRADKNNPNLQISSSWKLLGDNKMLTSIATAQGKLFAAGTDTMYVLSAADTLAPVYNSPRAIQHLDAGSNDIWISEFKDGGSGMVKKMDLNYQLTDSFNAGFPKQVLELSNGEIWFADAYTGLSKRIVGSSPQFVRPIGPRTYSAFSIQANNGEVWVAHGSYNDRYVGTSNMFGISKFKDESWSGYSGYDFGPMQDSIYDFVAIAKNPADGSVWAGSLHNGLFILKADGSYEMLYHGSPLESKIGEPDVIAANSFAADQNGTMWFTQHGAQHELAARTLDGNWYHFSLPYSRTYPHGALGLTIDDYDQKWFFSPLENSIIVFSDNGTIDNPSDDRSIFLTGAGAGISGNKILTMTKDKNGEIWVGTDNGITIFNCAGNVLDGTCKGEQRIVQYDQFAGYLFQGEQVKAIAVDGANRKWIGTNNGIWLISPDGDKIINRFTKDNSPLPSNGIITINIDPVTGDVYIATEMGMMSYRGTATDGGTTNSNVVIFPNPVKSGYKGSIAIRGLVNNADVRITDMSGQLVYRTTANGGQAVWGGTDYKGHRPQTGVYLVFVTNKDGSQTHVGKLVFIE